MSRCRLPVLIPAGLLRRVRIAAQRSRLSAGAWVRQAIARYLADDKRAGHPLDRLRDLGAPTGDLDQMLTEIQAGAKRRD